VDEDSDTEPDRPAGKVMLEAEELAADEAPGAVAFRLAGIYGPGRERLVTAARRGECPAGEANRWLNQIHADDAADLAAELLTLPSPPKVVVGVDREPARRSDVLGWLRERLGVPADPSTPTPPSRDRGSKRCRSPVGRCPLVPPRLSHLPGGIRDAPSP
jgi:nucleoside-diphosphate-sugar epimerase